CLYLVTVITASVRTPANIVRLDGHRDLSSPCRRRRAARRLSDLFAQNKPGTGSIIDSQLTHTFANRPAITKITQANASNPRQNPRRRPLTVQTVEPSLQRSLSHRRAEAQPF